MLTTEARILGKVYTHHDMMERTHNLLVLSRLSLALNRFKFPARPLLGRESLENDVAKHVLEVKTTQPRLTTRLKRIIL